MPVLVGLYIEAQEGVTWEVWRRAALEAEALGYDLLGCSVHLRSLEGAPGWRLDLWPVMTAIALWTRRIAFGPLVLPVGFYHPAHIARAAAALDRLSGGRFQLGLGAGRDAAEYRAFGLPFPPHDERIAMLAEGVEIIRRLWEGEPVTFRGRWYTLDGAQIEPVPLRRWLGIGGNSDATLRLAACCADEWSTTGRDVAELRARNRRLDALAHEAGRDPAAIARTVMDGVLIGRGPSELERRACRMADLVPSLRGQPVREIIRRLADEWGWWVGTPDEVRARVTEAVGAGFGRVCFQVYDAADVAAMRLLAEEVLPALRSSEPAAAAAT